MILFRNKAGAQSTGYSVLRLTGYAVLFLILTSVLLSPLTLMTAAEDAGDKVEKAYGECLAFLTGDGEDGSIPAVVSYLEANCGTVPGECWYVLPLAGGGNRTEFESYALKLLMSRYLSASVPEYDLKTAIILASVALPEATNYIDGTVDSLKDTKQINVLLFLLRFYGAGYGTSPAEGEEHCLNSLLDAQLEDGGWTYAGKVSDPDMTSMVLQSLAPYINGNRVCDSVPPDRISGAVEKALLRLSGLQGDDGVYSSYGVKNAESTAQVICALSSLGIDAKADERFVKGGFSAVDALLSFQAPDGGFSHVKGGSPDKGVTSQVFMALSSYLAGNSSGGIFLMPDADREAAASATLPEITTSLVTGETTGNGDAGTSDVSTPRIVFAVVIALSALSICIVMLIKKKRKAGGYLTVLIVAALIIASVLFIRIETPEEHKTGYTGKQDPTGSVTLMIECLKVAGQTGKYPSIPEDGIILDNVEMEIADGDTVLDILIDASAKYGLILDTSGSGVTAYIKSVSSLGERDFGDMSGWLYRVNGELASVGCGAYKLEDGDVILWSYTVDGIN